MFSQQQLIQLEYALKYVIQDLETKIYDNADAKWLGELCGLLAAVQAEQHKASQAD